VQSFGMEVLQAEELTLKFPRTVLIQLGAGTSLDLRPTVTVG